MTQPGNELERDLRQALRREEPSAGFVARVLTALPKETPRPVLAWMHRPALRWALAAVIVVAASTGGYFYREHRLEEERGRIAKQQLMLALRITGAKLQLAQQRVLQINRSDSTQDMEKQQ